MNIRQDGKKITVVHSPLCSCHECSAEKPDPRVIERKRRYLNGG